MRILISGICGFVGSSLSLWLKEHIHDVEICGVDNFIRPGSELNREQLTKLGVKIHHADIRNPSDLENLGAIDWVIDAAANPSVLAGVDGHASSRQLVEHNLSGTLNLLELCKSNNAGFILLSTSRVYSIPALSSLEMEISEEAFRPTKTQTFPKGISTAGISEDYTTQAPVSLYGSTKIASEAVALEYGYTFGFPVWVNRCGVLAGAGQFGRPDQGIFAYWIHSWHQRNPLQYIGFDGQGHQVRDCLHPSDLARMLQLQMARGEDSTKSPIINLSGGASSARSLKQLSNWCRERFGDHTVGNSANSRRFDIPWMLLDSSRANKEWQWMPACSTESILNEIAEYAEANPDWLKLSAPY